MDTTSTALTSTGAVMARGIAYRIWMAIKGRRLVSDCCGRQLEVGVDVRDMPPTPTHPEKTNPPEQPSKEKHGRSLSGYFQKAKSHRGETKKEVSEKKHQHPTVAVEDISPVSAGSASSASIEYDCEKGSPSGEAPSLPHSVAK